MAGAEGPPKWQTYSGVEAGAWERGAEGTGGQVGQEWGLGPELNPHHPCQIVL